jgi:hypothetical protein
VEDEAVEDEAVEGGAEVPAAASVQVEAVISATIEAPASARARRARTKRTVIIAKFLDVADFRAATQRSRGPSWFP